MKRWMYIPLSLAVSLSLLTGCADTGTGNTGSSEEITASTDGSAGSSEEAASSTDGSAGDSEDAAASTDESVDDSGSSEASSAGASDTGADPAQTDADLFTDRDYETDYEESGSVFENLSFTVKSGEKVVIVGKNGSGKSTLTKLLCGLFTNYHGSLKVNGTELSEFSMDSFRKQIAYAAQDPFLFEGSVRENIHLGNLNASDAETDELVDRLGIRELSEKKISAGQKELSGGEKQKISIARALLKNTSLLILDEPSNNLDQQTIEWLQNLIVYYPKTILYISHDQKMIELADQKICLES